MSVGTAVGGSGIFVIIAGTGVLVLTAIAVLVAVGTGEDIAVTVAVASVSGITAGGDGASGHLVITAANAAINPPARKIAASNIGSLLSRCLVWPIAWRFVIAPSHFGYLHCTSEYATSKNPL